MMASQFTKDRAQIQARLAAENEKLDAALETTEQLTLVQIFSIHLHFCSSLPFLSLSLFLFLFLFPSRLISAFPGVSNFPFAAP
jgi:hypothetical protein